MAGSVAQAQEIAVVAELRDVFAAGRTRDLSWRLEQLRGIGHGQPGLAGPGRADAEHQLVPLQRADIGILRRRARPHRLVVATGAVRLTRAGGRLTGAGGRQASRKAGTGRGMNSFVCLCVCTCYV